MNCACMSVGKPGNGFVIRSTAFGLAGPWQRMRSSVTVTADPASSSLASIADMWRGSAPVTVTSPPVMAAATSRVPASMRSGMTRCRAPPSSGTPSISMRSVPAPSMRAPMADEQPRQVAHLRLPRRVLDHGGALGERGRHHEVLGPGHRDEIGR